MGKLITNLQLLGVWESCCSFCHGKHHALWWNL